MLILFFYTDYRFMEKSRLEGDPFFRFINYDAVVHRGTASNHHARFPMAVCAYFVLFLFFSSILVL